MIHNKLNELFNQTPHSLKNIIQFPIRSNLNDKLDKTEKIRSELGVCMSLEQNTFKMMTSLVYLDLSLSKIWSLKSGCFNGLVNLKRLNLNFCNINQIEENAFSSSLANLEALILSHNKLRLIEKHYFNNLLNLKQLNLSNNKLESIQDGSFNCLKNLNGLDLSSNNKLNSIKCDVFEQNVNLRQLILDVILKNDDFEEHFISNNNLKLRINFISLENDLNNNYLS